MKLHIAQSIKLTSSTKKLIIQFWSIHHVLSGKILIDSQYNYNIKSHKSIFGMYLLSCVGIS